MNRLTLLFQYFFLLLAQVTIAQESFDKASYTYKITPHNSKNGLSHNAIYDIAKDNNNNILVLNRVGLDIIVNGKATNIQKFSNNYHHSLSKVISKKPESYWLVFPNFIVDLNQDQSQSFEVFSKEARLFPRLSQNTHSIFTTENQEIFFLTKDRKLLHLSSPDSIETILNEFPLDTTSNNAYHLIKYLSGKWLYLKEVDSRQQEQYHIINLSQKTITSTTNANAFKETVFPAKQWSKKSRHLQAHHSLPDFLVSELDFIVTDFPFGYNTFYDSYSQLFWYIDNKTLFGFHPTEGLIHQIEIPKVNYRKYNMVFTKEKIWLSTLYDGIFEVSIIHNKFITIHNKGFNLRNITKDQEEQIWFASNGIKVTNDKVDSIKLNLQQSNYLVALDQAGFIWNASTYGDTLFKYNDRFQKVEQFVLDLQPKYGSYWSMVIDKDGTVWLSGSKKMIGITPDNKIHEILFEYPLNHQIYHIEIANELQFWLCTDAGLFLLNRSTGQLQQFSNTEQGNYSLPAKDFHHIYIDQDSIYWLATGDMGFLRWDKKNSTSDNKVSTIKVYDSFFGMPSNIMHAVYEDEYGFLWISSEYGLIQFHKESEHFRIFLEEDGIINNEFNRASHFKDKDGNIYFGGVKGLMQFHPKDFRVDTTSSSISIFQLKKVTDDITYNFLPQYLSTKAIQFNSVNDIFSLNFGSVHPNTKEALYYSYNQKHWVQIKDQSLTINNLAAGDHTLYIKKENIAGDILGTLTIPINIPKPFYLKWWFYSLVLLALIGLVRLLLMLQRRRYLTQQMKLEAVIQKRTHKIQQDKTLIEKQAKSLINLHNKKSILFKNIAHELRNPLTLIFGATKMLEKQISHIKDHKLDEKYLKAITSSGDKILSLTDEVLLLAKLEANTETPHLAPISLFLLFDKIVTQFKGIADFQNKELHFDYELSKDYFANIDAVKTEKIIANLLSNAFKYSPRGAKVFLNVRKQQDRMVIEVKDTGYGISKKELPLIFEPYYRSERITNLYDALEGTGGTGIGLSIVKKLVDLLAGEITARSELNKGTTFTLQLPLRPFSQDQLTKLIQPEQKEKLVSSTVENTINENAIINRNHHILIVDDHSGVVNFIKDLLEPYYKISTAYNGKSAIEIIQEKSNSKPGLAISLIICDIMMPEMDGLLLVKQLKKHMKWKWIPIIFLTAYNNVSTKQWALRIGIEDYIAKPFNPDELMVRIKNLLNKKYKNHRNGVSDITKPYSFNTEWINHFNQIVNENIENINIDLDFLASKMAIGKRQLNRKIKEHTGLTPGKYVQEVRLQKARMLLEDKAYFSVSAVAYSVGFKSPKYFSHQFKERFGRLPSSYLE